MNNQKIADIFDDIAKILEFKQDNIFKIRAYQKAAVTLRSLTEDIAKYAKNSSLTSLPGIGKDLADKINEILKTGTLKVYQGLKKSVPEGLMDVMSIPGVGPKKAKLLYDELKIDSVEKLKEAAEKHKLSALPHLKEKTEQNILQGIKLLSKAKERMLLGEALPAAEGVVNYLKDKKGVEKIEIAGSTRRQKETIRDIDILVASENPPEIIKEFTHMPHTEKILAEGRTKASVLTGRGLQIDLRVVDVESYGAALVYFTGSKEHNIRIRELAIKKGLKVNEYGVFTAKGTKINKKIAGKTETEVYKALNLEFIPPELREDKGEIEAALENRLPELVKPSDIKGDLHVHSNYSDGAHAIEEIANTCRDMGYKYVVISDHSKSLKIARGLSEEELKRKNKEIDQLNKKFKNFKILKGSEVDILSDGTLDYPDDVLKELDAVFVSIHSGFKQPMEKITERILKAMDNKYAHILSHPTGRLLNARDPYAVDIDRVLKHAKQTHTAIEINGNVQRLDLDDINARAAADMGIKLALTTDTHRLDNLQFMRYAVSVARRAWLTRKDALNALPLQQLLKALKK